VWLGRSGSFPPVFVVTPLGRPVLGSVRPPGSKSLTNRALVVAALVRAAPSRIAGPLEADDTVAMRSALRSFGVLIDDNDDPWLVLGAGGDLEAPSEPVDVGASGTTARFVSALAAVAGGTSVVDGTERMRRRPIGPLVDGLRAQGIRADATDGCPPVTVTGGVLAGGTVEVDSSRSSQFASALLMVSPLARSTTELRLGGRVVSRSYLDGTVDVMRAFGAEVEALPDRFVVQPTGYRKAHYEVEADASAAVYPAVAAAVTGGRVVVRGIPAGSTQPDLAILSHLARMGCVVDRTGDDIVVEGPDGPLTPIDADLTQAPDGAMALAVATLFADGPSRLRGLSTLRLKETDRLTALSTELRRLGADVQVEDDTLAIVPGDLRGGEIETYDDHRMAMALAVAGLVVPGVVIRDPGTVTKTWPRYFDMLSSL
jgi:3-phosphoshikimate 1-carboxyvinyltransferase